MMHAGDPETLKKQFAKVSRPVDLLKCEKTMSGKHRWMEVMFSLHYKYPSKTAIYKKCLACGIINDLENK